MGSSTEKDWEARFSDPPRSRWQWLPLMVILLVFNAFTVSIFFYLMPLALGILVAAFATLVYFGWKKPRQKRFPLILTSGLFVGTWVVWLGLLLRAEWRQ